MSLSAKPSAEGLVTALAFKGLPEPPRDWFKKDGACYGAPADQVPGIATGRPKGEVAASFLRNYCGRCVAAVECTSAVLREPNLPIDTIRGGFGLRGVPQVWRAARAITRFGSPEAAAEHYNLSLEGVQPLHSVSRVVRRLLEQSQFASQPPAAPEQLPAPPTQ